MCAPRHDNVRVDSIIMFMQWLRDTIKTQNMYSCSAKGGGNRWCCKVSKCNRPPWMVPRYNWDPRFCSRIVLKRGVRHGNVGCDSMICNTIVARYNQHLVSLLLWAEAVDADRVCANEMLRWICRAKDREQGTTMADQRHNTA